MFPGNYVSVIFQDKCALTDVRYKTKCLPSIKTQTLSSNLLQNKHFSFFSSQITEESYDLCIFSDKLSVIKAAILPLICFYCQDISCMIDGKVRQKVIEK